MYISRTNYISSPIPDVLYEYVTMKPLNLGWKRITDTSEHISIQKAQYMFFEAITNTRNNIPFNRINTIASLTSKLPSHYTEAGLVKKLEELGIGRPSTFSFLVDVIQKRGYVKITDVEGIVTKCSEITLDSSDKEIKENNVEKEFAKESKKLVIQPIGIAALEFLLRYFDGFLNYDYTSKMEERLDEIAKGVSKDNIEPNLCRECYNTLESIIKPIKSEINKEYPLDPHHSVIFTYKGPVIKYTPPNINNVEEGIVYKNIKPGIKIDIVKLDCGEYSLDELLELQNDCLGVYEGEPVYIRHGRYGVYIQWGNKNISVKHINKPIDQITLSDVETVINFTASDVAASAAAEAINKNVLRIVTPDISARKGKYGPYFYYKTREMTDPIFVSMTKDFRSNYMHCDSKIIEEYVLKKMNEKVQNKF